MLKKPGMILLAIGVGGLLSSCHIEQKDVETIKRTTENLRVHQANEFIEYSVTAAIINSGTFNQGILRVEWEQTADLIDPFDSDTKYTVLKETTTLAYFEPGGTTPGDPISTVIRYISQDAAGNITLYAIDDGTVPLYWLYDPNYGDLSSNNFIRPIIFDSPMMAGTPPNSAVHFSVMEGCELGLCQSEIYTFNENLSVKDKKTAVTTNMGIFSDPFEIESISGSSTPSGAPTISFSGDIRTACGTSFDNISYDSAVFVMPDIGMVRMTNVCRNLTSGENVNYIITLNNTNIPLPPSSP